MDPALILIVSALITGAAVVTSAAIARWPGKGKEEKEDEEKDDE